MIRGMEIVPCGGPAVVLREPAIDSYGIYVLRLLALIALSDAA
jgi:hypothetical protein